MANTKVLFVDDEEAILKSFCTTFRHKGYETSGASSGEEAISMMRKVCFEVVVTDLKMRGIDGIQVLKEARNLCPGVIVIILTGYGDLNSAIDSLRLGADDYLHKPCDMEELLFRVSRCLEKKEVEKELNLAKIKNDRYEMITTLATGLSHDFNNILTSIIGSIQLADRMVLAGQSPAAHLELAQKACSQARNLTEKFNQLSVYKPVISAVPPEIIIRSAIEQLGDRGVLINFAPVEDCWQTWVDYEKITMALKAILINGLEALPHGGSIEISATNYSDDQSDPSQIEPGRYVKVTIQDNGRGITTENLGKIFDPYFSTRAKGSKKGVGLGLTLASRFIKKNRGHIHVESEVNKGTTVSVYLPAVS